MNFLSRTPTVLKVISAFCFLTGIGYQSLRSYVKHNWDLHYPAIVTKHAEHGKILESSPKIDYEYDYHGQHYTEEAWAQTSSFFPETREEFYQRFPIGHKMQIFVNPKNPERSMLKRDVMYHSNDQMFLYLSAFSLYLISSGMTRKSVNMIITGFIMTPIGLYLPFVLLTKNENRKKKIEEYFGRHDNGSITDDITKTD